MKKLLLLLTASIMLIGLLVLSGCGAKEPLDNGPETNDQGEIENNVQDDTEEDIPEIDTENLEEDTDLELDVFEEW